jgi:hypothetical protein
MDLAVMGMMRSGTTLVADFVAGELAPRPRVELVAIFGLLELVEDLPRFLANLRRYALPVVASYYVAEDTSDLDRSAFGWRNHLRRDALDRMLRGAGFAVAAKWGVDGRRGILRLRGAGSGEPKREAVRE